MKTGFKIILCCALAAVIFGVAGVRFAHQRTLAARDSCLDTLRQIDGAKQQWALEHFYYVTDEVARANATPTWEDIHIYGGRGELVPGPWGSYYPPRCPSGGTYTVGKMLYPPTCSHPGHVLE